jgi:class 3 adenylate cyclase
MPVICSQCGTANDAGRKFCLECGSPLAAVCPNCGSANPPAAKFCGECATPLTARAASAAPAPQFAEPGPAAATGAERRLVSILFADLVGFTTFAEERDAEEVRDTLTRYFDLARDVIERYGGTVEKFIGDAVMAVWGAPTAHEDDAERAVRSGLDLVVAVRALGPGIQARAGVLTGEAAVTLGATNQGLVAGDLVNTASRLQSVAPPGSVLVGQATQRAASGAIVFEEAGEQFLKGKSSPVPAWRALRVVAERGGRNRSEGIEAPVVGRDDDLQLLKDLFHATVRDRRTRLVSVLGPGGIGKSRLAWEFLKYLDGLVDGVYWHDGRSPAYGEGITFWALGEMVRARCGLLETDDEATTRVRVRETVAKYVSDEREARWVEAALLTLLGVGNERSTDQLFAAWRTFFERLAATDPVVMVFEDLQFADAGLLDFIDHLLEWSRGVPILIVTLARPELLERPSDWGARKRNFASLSLEPLPDDAMRELLAGLVPGLPKEAVAAIVQRAGGIPLYAVETVRMLVSEGRLREDRGRYVPTGDLAALAVPETLTALIGSRLDALSPELRTLLQDSAVLGQSFTTDALAAVSGISTEALEPQLTALVRRELLRRDVDPRSPERGQYAFVQALIREVAYNTLARRDRKARHLAAARYFEGLGSDELAGALARHYLAAHANAAEGSEADALAGQARIALRAAAERAIELGSQLQAVTFLDQAADITHDPADEAELRERAAAAAEQGGRGALAEERARRAVELRRGLGDPSSVARAYATLGNVLLSMIRRDAAVAELASAAEELLPPEQPLDANGVELLAQLARAYMLHEEADRAIAVTDRALVVAERLELLPAVSSLLITRGVALCNDGRALEGMGAMQMGVEIAAEQHLAFSEMRGRLNIGVVLTNSDPAMGFRITREALAMATRLGIRSFARTLRGNLTVDGLEVGEWDLVAAELMSALDEEVDDFGRNYMRWGLLVVHFLRGADTRAEAAAMQAWSEGFEDANAREGVHSMFAERAFSAGEYGVAFDEFVRSAAQEALNAPRAFLFAGISALLLRDAGRAQDALDRLTATGMHGRVVRLDRSFLHAGIVALTGSPSTAVLEFRDALAGYRDLGVQFRPALAGVVMATVLDPGTPEVREAADRAREMFTRVGAKPLLAVLESALERRPAEPATPTSARLAVADAAIPSS